MVSTGLRIGSVLLCIVALPTATGCTQCEKHKKTGSASAYGGRSGSLASAPYWGSSEPGLRAYQGTPSGERTTAKCRFCNKTDCPGCNRGLNKTATRVAFPEDLPPDAQSGQCFAQVYLPPKYDTVTERILVRDESEKLEVIPAKYEWVEETVLVKEASTELVEIPAEFDSQDRVVQTPGHTTWVKAQQDFCKADTVGPPPQDIFCLVAEPPSTMTIQQQRMVKPASVKEINVPAEYQTLRKQKLVRPASTRWVRVPAEYEEVEKTVMIAPGRMGWQRVECDQQAVTQGLKADTNIRRVGDFNPD